MSFIKKYRHGLFIGIYAAFYMILFKLLELREISGYHVIYSPLDSMIPFCEVFIVPYLLWFPYLFLTVLYFIFINKDKAEYYRFSLNLMLGMTIFIFVSLLYPNIQHLRPLVMPRDNIFTDAVRILYKVDTPTNILPSIHVYHSIACYIAIADAKVLRKNRFIQMGAFILMVLVVLSTMFLKQHSIIDVSMGTTLSVLGYLLFYQQAEVTAVTYTK